MHEVDRSGRHKVFGYLTNLEGKSVDVQLSSARISEREMECKASSTMSDHNDFLLHDSKLAPPSYDTAFLLFYMRVGRLKAFERASERCKESTGSTHIDDCDCAVRGRVVELQVAL